MLEKKKSSCSRRPSADLSSIAPGIPTEARPSLVSGHSMRGVSANLLIGQALCQGCELTLSLFHSKSRFTKERPWANCCPRSLQKSDMSKSFSSHLTKERPWAIRSRDSLKKSKRAIRSKKRGNRYRYRGFPTLLPALPCGWGGGGILHEMGSVIVTYIWCEDAAGSCRNFYKKVKNAKVFGEHLYMAYFPHASKFWPFFYCTICKTNRISHFIFYQQRITMFSLMFRVQAGL